MPGEDVSFDIDRAEVEPDIRHAMASMQALLSRPANSEYGMRELLEGWTGGFSSPFSDLEMEVAIALNVVLDIVTRRAVRAGAQTYPGLFEARDVLIAEIEHRRLPLLAVPLEAYETNEGRPGR